MSAEESEEDFGTFFRLICGKEVFFDPSVREKTDAAALARLESLPSDQAIKEIMYQCPSTGYWVLDELFSGELIDGKAPRDAYRLKLLVKMQQVMRADPLRRNVFSTWQLSPLHSIAIGECPVPIDVLQFIIDRFPHALVRVRNPTATVRTSPS